MAVSPRVEGGRELARMLATLAWVVAGTAIALGGLGAVPTLLGAEPRGLRTVATVADAERILGMRLAEPGYFPQRLAWPPERVRVAGTRGGSVAMTIAARDGGSRLDLLQAAPGAEIAPELRGGERELNGHPTAVAGHPARISDVLLDGDRWTVLSWELGGRPIVLRSRGSVEELYRMARSTRVEGGR